MSDFGIMLRQFRKDAGLTQKQLAIAAALSQRVISDLERGAGQTAAKEVTARLADVLELTGPTRTVFEAAARGYAPAGVAAATRTLPQESLSFTGREPELRELGQAATDARDNTLTCIIGGMAGVGKTTLALRAAYQLVPQFPDGQIYLELHAHTAGQDPVDPADAVASLLQTLGLGAEQIPVGLEARARLWRDRTSGQRLLVVLDDAATSDQVRPLLPGSSASLVLVTGRRRLTALEDAVVISLDVLRPAEAAELLVRLAARPGLDVNDPAVAEICRRCGYLPLAIVLLAGRMHQHESWSTSDFATDLATSQDRLAPIHAENRSVTDAFDLSYQDLNPGQQRMFRRLGLHPGTDIDAYAAAALDNVSLTAARTTLDGLFDHYLLAESARARYQFHDLIREYARQLATTDPAQERADAMGRLLEYFLYPVGVAGRAHRRRRTAGPVAKSKHVKPAPDVADRSAAIAWLSAERLNLPSVADSGAAQGKAIHPAAMPAAMHTFLRSRGRWDEPETLEHSVVEVAREIGAKQAQARALTDLGDMQYLTDDYPAAEASLRMALQMCTEVDDRLGQADALRELGAVHLAGGEHDAAASSLNRALDLYMSLSDKIGEADTLRELGAVQQARGHYQDAARSLERALTLYRELDDRLGEADALTDIGSVRLGASDYDGAARSHQAALELHQVLGDRLGEANASRHLGTVHHMRGAHEEAKASLDRAVLLYEGLGDPSGEAEALNNLGELALRTGDYDQARELHERALVTATRIAAPREQARAHEGVGRSCLSQGEVELGETSVRRAVEIYQRIGSPHATRAAKLLRDHRKAGGGSERTTSQETRPPGSFGRPELPTHLPSASGQKRSTNLEPTHTSTAGASEYPPEEKGTAEEPQSTIAPTRGIYISHSSDDDDCARRLADFLRGRGLEVRVGREEPESDDITDVVATQAIDDAAAIVLLVTPAASASAYCRREWSEALAASWREPAALLFSVLIGEANPPAFCASYTQVSITGDADLGAAAEEIADAILRTERGQFKSARTWDIGWCLDSGLVHQLSWSPDGRSLVTAGDDGAARIWDVARSDLRSTLQAGPGAVRTVAYSPDGSLVAAGGDDEQVWLWHLRDVQERRRLEGSFGTVRAAAFSPDGRVLATAGDDAGVQLWDTPTNRLRSRMSAPAQVHSVAFSADGGLLAFAGGKDIQLWNIRASALQSIVTYRRAEASAISFSPDSALLAVAGTREIGLWDLAQGRWRTKLGAAQDTIRSVAFAPDGRLIAGGAQGVAWIWDVLTGEEVASLPHDGIVRSMAFSPDGQYLVSSDDATVQGWTVPVSLMRRRLIEIESDARALQPSPGELQRRRESLEDLIPADWQESEIDDPSMASNLVRLALVARAQGDLEEARDLLSRALDVQLRIFGRDHGSVASTLVNLAEVAVRHGDLEEARDLLSRALDVQLRIFGPDHASVASTLVNLAEVAVRHGDLGRARAMLTQARETITRSSHLYGTRMPGWDDVSVRARQVTQELETSAGSGSKP